MGGRLLRGLPVLLAVFATTLMSARPAAAHPFGPPQTAEITTGTDGTTAQVHWQVGAVDDFSYLAVGLGLTPGDRTTQPGALLYVKEDVQRLAASSTFRTYVADHIAVTNDGTPCPGTVGSAANLVASGITVSFACTTTITHATVTLSMLTDLHSAYRTLATGPHGQRFVYTLGQPSHDWSFGASATGAADGTDLARSAVLQISVVLLALVAVGAGTLVWFRRRAKRVPA